MSSSWRFRSEVVRSTRSHHAEPLSDGLTAWHVDVDDVDAPGDGHVGFVLEVPIDVGEWVGFGVGATRVLRL